MPDETRADFVKQTDIKTEILPTNLSELTSVVSEPRGAVAPTNVVAANFTSVPDRKRRGFGVAAAGIGLLLVAALVAGGLYTVKPTLFGNGQKDVEKGADTGSTVPPVANTNAAPTSNGTSIETGSSSTQPANNEIPTKIETTHPVEPMTKPVETTKDKKPTPEDRPRQGNDDPNLRLTHSDLPGDIVVTERNADGSTSTRVVKNGQRPANVPIPPYMMGPTSPGLDMRNLTLKQKQQIRAYMRNHNGQLPPGIPRP